jgi:hypothetical protein
MHSSCYPTWHRCASYIAVSSSFFNYSVSLINPIQKPKQQLYRVDSSWSIQRPWKLEGLVSFSQELVDHFPSTPREKITLGFFPTTFSRWSTPEHSLASARWHNCKSLFLLFFRIRDFDDIEIVQRPVVYSSFWSVGPVRRWLVNSLMNDCFSLTMRPPLGQCFLSIRDRIQVRVTLCSIK